MTNETLYFKFSLKSQQEKAFGLLQSFIAEATEKVFILKGFAGTGKTTLMSGLIKWFNEEELKYSLLASIK